MGSRFFKILFSRFALETWNAAAIRRSAVTRTFSKHYIDGEFVGRRLGIWRCLKHRLNRFLGSCPDCHTEVLQNYTTADYGIIDNNWPERD